MHSGTQKDKTSRSRRCDKHDAPLNTPWLQGLFALRRFHKGRAEDGQHHKDHDKHGEAPHYLRRDARGFRVGDGRDGFTCFAGKGPLPISHLFSWNVHDTGSISARCIDSPTCLTRAVNHLNTLDRSVKSMHAVSWGSSPHAHNTQRKHTGRATMEFDVRNMDATACPLSHVHANNVSALVPVVPTLCGEAFFESAPDDDDDDNEARTQPTGKASIFAKHFGEGKDAEKRFLVACERQGWRHVPTSVFDDRVRRIDCVVHTPRGFLVVDVKGAKRLRRSDPDPQFRFHWLELHATGSLFSGESKVMALEVGPGRFALFAKERIRAWIRPRLQDAQPVPSAAQALFRPYQRAGKVKEWITLVDVADMTSMCEGVIE